MPTGVCYLFYFYFLALVPFLIKPGWVTQNNGMVAMCRGMTTHLLHASTDNGSLISRCLQKDYII